MQDFSWWKKYEKHCIKLCKIFKYTKTVTNKVTLTYRKSVNGCLSFAVCDKIMQSSSSDIYNFAIFSKTWVYTMCLTFKIIKYFYFCGILLLHFEKPLSHTLWNLPIKHSINQAFFTDKWETKPFHNGHYIYHNRQHTILWQNMHWCWGTMSLTTTMIWIW